MLSRQFDVHEKSPITRRKLPNYHIYKTMTQGDIFHEIKKKTYKQN